MSAIEYDFFKNRSKLNSAFFFLSFLAFYSPRFTNHERSPFAMLSFTVETGFLEPWVAHLREVSEKETKNVHQSDSGWFG
jgi:hypothetical protein